MLLTKKNLNWVMKASNPKNGSLQGSIELQFFNKKVFACNGFRIHCIDTNREHGNITEFPVDAFWNKKDDEVFEKNHVEFPISLLKGNIPKNKNVVLTIDKDHLTISHDDGIYYKTTIPTFVPSSYFWAKFQSNFLIDMLDIPVQKNAKLKICCEGSGSPLNFRCSTFSGIIMSLYTS